MNPARSCERITCLPSTSVAKPAARSVVSGLVTSDETSSTSGSTGTGLKKWRPTTCAGRPGGHAQLHDRDRRRVRGEDRLRRVHDLVEGPEDVGLDRLGLGDRLHDQMALAQRPEVGAEGERLEGLLLGGGVELPPSDRGRERRLDPLPAGLDRGVVGVDHAHVEAVAGAHLGNARPHQPAPDDADSLDLHDRTIRPRRCGAPVRRPPTRSGSGWSAPGPVGPARPPPMLAGHPGTVLQHGLGSSARCRRHPRGRPRPRPRSNATTTSWPGATPWPSPCRPTCRPTGGGRRPGGPGRAAREADRPRPRCR